MSRMIELTCPDPKCGWQWSIDYQKLQAYKVVYRGDSRRDRQGAALAGATRVETYSLLCPNPAHGEKVTFTLSITEPPK